LETNKRFPKFIPERLIEAREIRGITSTELASNVGISQQAISKFESKDSSGPSFETLEKISEILHVPINYFYKPKLANNQQTVIFFRSKAAATVKSKKVHSNKLEWIREISKYAENLLAFPKVQIPRFIDRDNFIPTELEEIEEYAHKIRVLWGLGNGPISNVVLLLEKMGATVARSPFSDYDIDACSFWPEDSERPYILLNNDKTAARSRFDVAHELGHLVLHSKIKPSEFNKKDNYKRIEKEANRFASAFLLPSQSFGREIFSTSLDHLVSLKKRWKISINAMVYRAVQLGIFSEYQYVYLKNKLAQRNWLYKEPLDDDLLFEEPELLKQAFMAIVSNGIRGKQDVVNEVGILREELEAITNLGTNYLSPDELGKVFTFKPR